MAVDQYIEFNYNDTTVAMDIFSQKDIEELRIWTKNLDLSKLVPKDLSDKQLVLFYNACYGDLNKAKLCIEKYYTCMKNCPQIFSNRVLKGEDLRKAANVCEVFILSGKSCDGYEVIFHRLHDTDPSKFNMEAIYKILFMVVDLCLSTRGPQSGYVFLFDMRGSKFGHFMRISLGTLRKLLIYFQEAIPVRMQAIHILNSEPIVDRLMTLIKPFMDKKFLSLIKFHNKTEEPEKLYEIVPKTYLPSNYGGDLPDSHILNEQCMEKLLDLEPYFKAEEEQRTAALLAQNEQEILDTTFSELDIF